MKVTFDVEKTTKNTFRFQEKENDLDPAPAIGTLYVQKWAVKQLVGDQDIEFLQLIVTIEVA